MEPNAQAKYMVDTHGNDALKEHDQIMKDICSIYDGDEEKAKADSMSYNHLVDVRQKIVEIIGCQCVDVEIHTDKNGINYCTKCKVETELLKSNKRSSTDTK